MSRKNNQTYRDSLSQISKEYNIGEISIEEVLGEAYPNEDSLQMSNGDLPEAETTEKVFIVFIVLENWHYILRVAFKSNIRKTLAWVFGLGGAIFTVISVIEWLIPLIETYYRVKLP